MDNTYRVIKAFLNNPAKNEEIWDSDIIIWVDWREYDEDIVTYFNDAIGNKIDVELQNHGKDYGDDIVLTY